VLCENPYQNNEKCFFDLRAGVASLLHKRLGYGEYLSTPLNPQDKLVRRPMTASVKHFIARETNKHSKKYFSYTFN